MTNIILVTLCLVITISVLNADIVLPGSEAWTRARRKAAGTGSLWPQGTIVYTVDDDVAGDLNMNEAITEALAIWRDKTCLRFIHQTTQHLVAMNYSTTNRYVRFRKGNRCHSLVGKQDGNGVQEFTISRTCAYPEVISLEIGHLVALWQEHRRWDRDNHVQVNWQNIAKKDSPYFDVVSNMELYAPYDLSSMMHYSMDKFSKNGRRTLVPLDESLSFLVGSQNRLSFYDLQTIHAMYQCSRRCSLSLVCHNGGFLTGDCTCKCPFGVSGLYCTHVRSSQGCGGIIQVRNGMHITSPNYPRKYTPKLNCNWLLVAPDDKVITAHFVHMNIEVSRFGSCRDKLQVRYSNIGIEQGPFFCGKSMTNQNITSSTHRMFLNFKTNKRGQRKGFNIKIVLTDKITCSKHYPCRNGGQCHQIDAIEAYQCVCRNGWVGKHCDVTKVDGGLTQWSPWSECTSKCGIRAKYRSCTNPPPSNGGRSCLGSIYESRQCGNPEECHGAFLCNFGNDRNPKICDFQQISNGRRDGAPIEEFDSLDWKVISGSTPSSGTGPIAGHTSGTPEDRYLYVEASNGRDGDKATIKLNKTKWKFGAHCIQFYYHMYGLNMGELQVLSKFNTKTSVIFQRKGEQGNVWKEANISIFLYNRMQLYFRVIRGNAFDSDIAIDDISISRGMCKV